MSHSSREYDKKFAIWWKEVQKLLQVPSMPDEYPYRNFDPYGVFDSGASALDFVKGLT